MAEWIPIEFRELGPQHLGRPVYIQYPEKYARDFLMGTLEWTASARTQDQLGLRGGTTFDRIKGSTEPQGVIYVLSD